MTVRVPNATYALAMANLAEAQRIATTLSGVTTLEALERAEQAVMRSPTKSVLRMAIRSVAASARQNRRADQTDDLAIPAYREVTA